MAPGNYGMEYLRQAFGIDPERSVKCSNFIGASLDMAKEEGAEAVLLVGHIGKLIKVAGGIMNTHSREADCRMELLAAEALRKGASRELAVSILDCATTEAALQLLEKENLLETVMSGITDKIKSCLNKRSDFSLRTECILFSNEFGELGRTEGAEELCRVVGKG